MSGTRAQSTDDHATRPRILLVDDEPSICAVLASVLGNLGYETVALSDPQAALRMIESTPNRPDLLITDFAMPQMSGLELIRRCKELQPSLKTILASGEVDQPGDISGPRPDAYLEKPFSTKELASLLRELVGPGPGSTGEKS
jgi:CheY-like chemotaxis protein